MARGGTKYRGDEKHRNAKIELQRRKMKLRQYQNELREYQPNNYQRFLERKISKIKKQFHL